MRTRVFSPTHTTSALVGGTSRPGGETVCIKSILDGSRETCLYLIYHSHTEVDWMTGVRIRMHFSVDILRHAESECLVMKLNDSHGPHCDEPAGTFSTTFATNTRFRKLRDRALMVIVSFL